MSTGGRKGSTVLALLIGALALPAVAGAAEPPSGDPEPAASAAEGTTEAAGRPISIEVKGRRLVKVLKTVRVVGKLAEPGPNKRVTIRVKAHGRRLFVRRVDPNDVTGAFRLRIKVRTCCRYTIVAQQGGHSSRRIHFWVRVPKGVGRGAQARLFHRLLRREGYHVQGIAKRSNWSTKLAILAFRKANGMSWSTKYKPKIFRKLLQGRGAFKPKHKRKGKHVEVDISRQVMALVKNGRAAHVFHVSTGAGGTPTVRGKFHFYLRQPGYNSKAMYYSIYFYGGYATHGYDPVPTYNASHGCVRNPIPYSVFIYNWVKLGMPIWVYD